MDIADKSDNAILRPGKKPVWRLVCPPDWKDTLLAGDMCNWAKRKGTFGADIELASAKSEDCCGAIFFSLPNGQIPKFNYWQLEYFFIRDGAEALVFEFDRFQKSFKSRRLAELRARAYPE